MTPLLYAARDGRIEAARLLIVAGADIEQSDANAIRPLLMAVLNNHLDVARLLIEYGADLVIRVRDRGPGIPEEELERVFEPFYRLESSRNRDSGGTGLGLSIARDVAQAHGGSLQLANAPGGGLEATLRLPRRG